MAHSTYALCCAAASQEQWGNIKEWVSIFKYFPSIIAEIEYLFYTRLRGKKLEILFTSPHSALAASVFREDKFWRNISSCAVDERRSHTNPTLFEWAFSILKKRYSRFRQRGPCGISRSSSTTSLPNSSDSRIIFYGKIAPENILSRCCPETKWRFSYDRTRILFLRTSIKWDFHWSRELLCNALKISTHKSLDGSTGSTGLNQNMTKSRFILPKKSKLYVSIIITASCQVTKAMLSSGPSGKK